jgi:hypothetical protein
MARSNRLTARTVKLKHEIKREGAWYGVNLASKADRLSLSGGLDVLYEDTNPSMREHESGKMTEVNDD